MRTASWVSRSVLALLGVVALFALYWVTKDSVPAGGRAAINPRLESDAGVPFPRRGQAQSESINPSVGESPVQGARQSDEGEGLELGAETQTGRPMSFLLHVRKSFARGAEAVGGVRVTVGVGRGKFKWGSPPIAQLVVLGEGLADARGDLHLDVVIPSDLLEVLEGLPLVLVARVDQKGYRRRNWGIPMPEAGVDHCEITVPAHKGVTLVGIVLGPNGDPVETGQVIVYQEQTSGQLGRRYRTQIDKTGHFELHFPQDGTWNIRAWTENVGAAVIRDCLVFSDQGQREVTLRLEGAGVLAGRVTDPDGKPIARYKLWAVPVDQSETTSGRFSEFVHLLNGSGGGTYDGHTQTNDDGEFRFSGLDEGLYLLRGTLGGDASFGALLTPQAVHTGKEGLQLMVARYTLEVSFLGADGLPVEAQSLSYPDWAELTKCTYYVHESDGQGQVLDPTRGVDGPRTRLEDGSTSIEVQAGKHYIVGALSSRHALVEREVFVDPTHFARKLSFDLALPRETGSLKLEVLDPAGKPLVDETRVLLIAPSGRTLFQGRTNGKRSEFILPLAPDRYHGRISAPPPRGIHGGRFGPERFIPVEFDVSVNPEFETYLPVRLGAGGWVRFSVRLHGAPESVIATAPAGDPWFALRNRLQGVWVEFLPSDGGPALTALFDHSNDSPTIPSISGDVENTWLVPGRREKIIDALPVGSYEVHLWRAGYEDRRVPVVIESGKTVDLELVLESSDQD